MGLTIHQTQYANEPGWAHFLRCHKSIISILDFWQKLGVTAETNDEGGYWESLGPHHRRLPGDEEMAQLPRVRLPGPPSDRE
jgi:hypothetical protein